MGTRWWVSGIEGVTGEPSCPPTVERTLRQPGGDYIDTN